MKKVVILVFLLAVAASIGFWYWTRPLKDVASSAESVCSDDVKDLVLLLKAVQGDESQCNKLEGDLNAYCLAYFGKDICSSRPSESQKSCLAVLNKNPGECDDEICHGILGNDEGCSSTSCSALARRESADLNTAEICKPLVERAVRDAECYKQARTPEQADACFNQSSLTV